MANSRATRIQAVALLAGAAALALYALLGHALVAAVYAGRSLPALNRMIAYAALHPLGFYFKKIDDLALYGAFVWFGAVLCWALAARRLAGRGWHDSLLFDRLVLLACSAGFYVFLVRYGYQREWYPIGKLMAYAGNPPFQQRILFIQPALALQALMPGLGAVQAFLCSQMLAALLALWAVKRFAGLFIRRDLSFIAQPLLVAIWAPTLTYYTFYDIGILFVVAFCLYHLFRHEFRPYLLMFALGTFNHESTLFLVAISGVVLLDRMPLRQLAALLLWQLALYALVRGLLYYWLPADRAWEGGKLPYNWLLLTQRPLELLAKLGPTLAWFGLAALGLPRAPPALRRCLLLLPCLLLMTLLFGQLHEARQFDAFIPVAVALIVARVAAAAAGQPFASGRAAAAVKVQA
jgi:hypothetical protein